MRSGGRTNPEHNKIFFFLWHVAIHHPCFIPHKATLILQHWSCLVATTCISWTCLYLSLSLSLSHLLSPPCRVFQFPHLNELNAGYNKLTAVPPEIGQLRTLTVLDLRYVCMCVWKTCSCVYSGLHCPNPGTTSCLVFLLSWSTALHWGTLSSPSTGCWSFPLSSTASRNWRISSLMITRWGRGCPCFMMQ